MQLKLRQALESDIEEIHSIEKQCKREPWSVSMLRPEFSHPWSRFRVASLEEEIVAFCLSWLVPDELHILNIATLPFYQRNGIARKMMHDAFQIAHEADALRICLEVRVSNEPARKLYDSFDFKEVGRRKKYYKNPSEDALVLVKSFPQTNNESDTHET